MPDEKLMFLSIMEYWTVALIAFHKSFTNGLIISHHSPDELATKAKFVPDTFNIFSVLFSPLKLGESCIPEKWSRGERGTNGPRSDSRNTIY